MIPAVIKLSSLLTSNILDPQSTWAMENCMLLMKIKKIYAILIIKGEIKIILGQNSSCSSATFHFSIQPYFSFYLSSYDISAELPKLFVTLLHSTADVGMGIELPAVAACCLKIKGSYFRPSGPHVKATPAWTNRIVSRHVESI